MRVMALGIVIIIHVFFLTLCYYSMKRKVEDYAEEIKRKYNDHEEI